MVGQPCPPGRSHQPEGLYLEGTQVSVLAPRAALTSLQALYLRSTQVSDLGPLAARTSLEGLDLQGTQVSDLAPIRQLIDAGLRVTGP